MLVRPHHLPEDAEGAGAGRSAAATAGALARGRLRLHPVVLLWTVFLVCGVGSAFMIYGLHRRRARALRVGTVYVVWPLVYVLLVSGAAQWGTLIGLARVMLVATWRPIGVYGVSNLQVAGWLPGFLYLPVDLGQAIGLYRGFIENDNFNNIASLLFLLS